MRNKVANIMDWVISETKDRGLGKYTNAKNVSAYAMEHGVVYDEEKGLYSVLNEANKIVIAKMAKELHPSTNFGGTIDVMADIMSLRMMAPADIHDKLVKLCKEGKDIECEVIKISRKTGIKYKDLMRYHTHMVLLDAFGYTA